MNDAQFGAFLTALVAGLGGIAAAIKFGIGRIVKGNDSGTAALIANTASNAVLTVKVDDLAKKIDNISDWMEHATPIGAPPTPRQPHRNTPVHGVPSTTYHLRPGTKGGDR